MTRSRHIFCASTIQRLAVTALMLLGSICMAPSTLAQNTPLIAGAAGFLTSTNGGNTSYLPVLAPVLEAPVGNQFQIEASAVLFEDFFPAGAGKGYDHLHYVNLSYLQLDYLATSHVTVVGGNFLVPFGTYNERLSPLWIGNFEDAPYVAAIGTMVNGRATGGMLRGSAVSTPNYSVDYAVYFSAHVTNEHFQSSRASGAKLEVYFPKLRLEVGTSYGRLLEGTQTDSYSGHLWWEPARVPLRFRSEYDHGAHAEGYWFEADYRLSHFGGPESLIGRLEPVFRFQQVFRRSPDPTDFLPTTGLQQADFGLDYNLPHGVRIISSYSREFSPAGNRNLWKTGIVYHFVFPTWKGES